MIRILIAICFFYTCGATIAQGKGEQAVKGYFAFGVHGSGDISGFQYGLQYSQLFSKKFS